MAKKEETKEIVYGIVKGEDILTAMKASENADKLRKDAQGQDGLVWNQTVHIIMQRIGPSLAIKQDTSKEGIQGNGDILKDIMSKYILEHTTIPEKGRNRAGEEFEVCDADGLPKWSSWAQTRRIWAYLGDIAKVLAYGQGKALYPELGKVCPRIDILNQCKTPESPINGVERLTKQLAEKLKTITAPVDRMKSHDLVHTLTVPGTDPVDEAGKLVNRLDALLVTMDNAQRDDVRMMLKRITKHFQAASGASAGSSAEHQDSAH